MSRPAQNQPDRISRSTPLFTPASGSGTIASIEGLRAISVLAVLLFHLDLPGFDGGYLGVDLFFVISGFVITRSIVGQHHQGELSLRRFYVSRLRRLLPSLLMVVIATLLAGLVLMPPMELKRLALSALAATFSLANFTFWL